jgi:hypothetical protein
VGAGGWRGATAVALTVLAALSSACHHKVEMPPPPPPARHFPNPIWDGLALGMTREQVARSHPIRPTVGTSGKDLRVWVYERPGEGTVELTFTGKGEGDTLRRVDVHYGPTAEAASPFIARFEETLGAPDAKRRPAVTNAYGDRTHDQYDTIWSDDDQYVFLTERVPRPGRPGRPVYYLTIRKKTLTAKGPPTGYVPPPALDDKGNPIEEPVF